MISSSRVKGIRTASQLGSVIFVPFMGVYLAAEIGIITLGTNTFLTVAAVIAVLVPALYASPRRCFRRNRFPQSGNEHSEKRRLGHANGVGAQDRQ
ncbi:MAG TPA: hypothetical protein VEJ19_05585 [Nitrososphaerales archaeon]|nr:hypothetical protein [Nitrososphaerales archaeon]